MQTTVQDVLDNVCSKRQLVLVDSFLRIRTTEAGQYLIPAMDERFQDLVQIYKLTQKSIDSIL